MSAAAFHWQDRLSQASPTQMAWYANRAEALRAKGDRLSPEDAAELAAIDEHMARQRCGVTALGPSIALVQAKREREAAIVKGDVEAAKVASDKIASLRAAAKLAREIQRAAPARAALRKARDDAEAARQAEVREANAKAQAEVDAVARVVADAIIALHKARLMVGERVTSRPTFAVWSRAMALAAADLSTLPHHVAVPLAELMTGAAL